MVVSIINTDTKAYKMTNSQSIQAMFEVNGIDMHNIHNAIQTASEMDFSPNRARDLLTKALNVDSKVVNDLVGDDEANFTLRYAINQYFEPLTTMELIPAHQRALKLLKRFPIVERDSINEDETTPNKINDDGVKLGKTGKPRKGYKKEMALSLYRENKDTIVKRADWVVLFVENISGMNKAVANTYIHNIETKKWIA